MRHMRFCRQLGFLVWYWFAVKTDGSKMKKKLAYETFVTYRRHGKIHCDLGWRTSRTTIFSKYQPRPGHESE